AGLQRIALDDEKREYFFLPYAIRQSQGHVSSVVRSRIGFLDDVSRLYLLSRLAFAFIDERLVADVCRLTKSVEELSGVIHDSKALVPDIVIVAKNDLNKDASAEHQGHHQKPDEECLRLDCRLIVSKSDHDCLTHAPLLLSRWFVSCRQRRDWQSSRRCRGGKAASVRSARHVRAS